MAEVVTTGVGACGTKPDFRGCDYMKDSTCWKCGKDDWEIIHDDDFKRVWECKNCKIKFCHQKIAQGRVVNNSGDEKNGEN